VTSQCHNGATARSDKIPSDVAQEMGRDVARKPGSINSGPPSQGGDLDHRQELIAAFAPHFSAARYNKHPRPVKWIRARRSSPAAGDLAVGRRTGFGLGRDWANCGETT